MAKLIKMLLGLEELVVAPVEEVKEEEVKIEEAKSGEEESKESEEV